MPIASQLWLTPPLSCHLVTHLLSRVFPVCCVPGKSNSMDRRAQLPRRNSERYATLDDQPCILSGFKPATITISTIFRQVGLGHAQYTTCMNTLFPTSICHCFFIQLVVSGCHFKTQRATHSTDVAWDCYEHVGLSYMSCNPLLPYQEGRSFAVGQCPVFNYYDIYLIYLAKMQFVWLLKSCKVTWIVL